MRILERYTLRSFLPPLAWSLGVFIGLYLVLDLLGHLDEILRYRVPLKTLIAYYALTIPLTFVQVAPFACLMATLYTLGNLNRHQELMAMRASGVGPFQMIRPLLTMGLLMSMAVLLVNEGIAPQAALTTETIRENRLKKPPDPNAPHRIIKTVEHLATYGLGHTLLYAKTFDPVAKTMEGIVILQHGPELALQRKITALKATWTGSQWRFENGTILQFNAQGQAVGRPVPFDYKIIRAGDRPEILERASSQADFMNTRDLIRYLQRFQGIGGAAIRRLRTDLFAKWAAAFSCLTLTLIGIPFAIQPIRGGGVLIGLSIGLGVGLIFFGVNALVIALGKGGWLPPFLAAWGTHVGFAAYALREAWRRLG